MSADGHADPVHAARGRGLQLAVALAMAACCAAAEWGAYALALQRYVAARAEEAGQRTTFYAQNLRGTLARYESLPRLAALEHVLHAALTAPHARDAALRRAADAYLKEVQAAADLTAVYLMDATGQTRAASNWDLPSSFIGRNYAFRPYFADAMREGLGRFYGVGNTTGETPATSWPRLCARAASPSARWRSRSTWIRSRRRWRAAAIPCCWSIAMA